MKRSIIIFALLFAAFTLFGQAAYAAEAAAGTETAATTDASTAAWKYIAAALAVGISCIAGGIAVGQIGSAAMGAMSENPELSGKALPYAGLAEGICLWGFLVALLILVIN